MKIAQIVPSLAARDGGPSKSVRGLSEALARSGSEVELLTTGLIETPSSSSVPPTLSVHAFKRDWPQKIARASGMAARLAQERYDIVHHHALWTRTLHQAARNARRNGAPLVISPRGMMSAWAWRHHRWKKRLAARFVHPGAFAAASGWHATSNDEADDIRRLGWRQPVCVSPNGVIAPSAGEQELESRHWLQNVPQLAGRPVALFYSRFHEKKRVLELIDLWLSKPRGDWALLVVGIPEQYTTEDLKARVLRANGGEKVFVADGTLRPPPYAVASLLLLPSHSENFGLVVAESLVRAVPALVTDTTPWAALDAQEAGRWVAWEEFGAGLDLMLSRPLPELRAMGDNARAWACSEFSWTKAAATLAHFYRELAGTR